MLRVTSSRRGRTFLVLGRRFDRFRRRRRAIVDRASDVGEFRGR